jgi:chromosome segregation ATPase
MDRYHTRTGDKLRELRQDKAMLQGALDAANEQVARLSRDYEAAQQVKRDALAEVKRLRADRASYSQRYEVLVAEVGQLRGIRELLVKSLVRATNEDEDAVREAPTSVAVRHENEVKRLRAELGSKLDQAAVHYGEVIERLETEVKRLRGMEEPLRTLYRFVMESWYARNIAVPSGVLERAYRATGLLLP